MARQKGKLTDLISTYEHLTQWCLEQNVISPAELAQFTETFRPSERSRLTETAKDFRDTLRDLLDKLLTRKEITSGILESINQLLAQQSGYTSLMKTHAGYEIRNHRDLDQAEQILTPIAESAAKFLCQADLRFLKKCSNPECTFFFYDTTKNHRRRWCSMQTCGNRMKVDAYWKRKRSPDV